MCFFFFLFGKKKIATFAEFQKLKEKTRMNTILGRQSFYQSCQKPEVHRPFDAPPNYICIQNAQFFLNCKFQRNDIEIMKIIFNNVRTLLVSIELIKSIIIHWEKKIHFI